MSENHCNLAIKLSLNAMTIETFPPTKRCSSSRPSIKDVHIPFFYCVRHLISPPFDNVPSGHGVERPGQLITSGIKHSNEL